MIKKYIQNMSSLSISLPKEIKHIPYDNTHSKAHLFNQTSPNYKNKGIGGGGFKTNHHGLYYEQLTNLESHYQIIKDNPHHQLISIQNRQWIITKKTSLFKYMEKKMNHQVPRAHGCKQPDKCFINEDTQTIFIIEKKFQQTGGSVCEKIQTSDFKTWQYSRSFPNYTIVYIYCLSIWFLENCVAELEYLNNKQVPVFWGDDLDYKTNIINFMVNYK